MKSVFLKNFWQVFILLVFSTSSAVGVQTNSESNFKHDETCQDGVHVFEPIDSTFELKIELEVKLAHLIDKKLINQLSDVGVQPTSHYLIKVVKGAKEVNLQLVEVCSSTGIVVCSLDEVDSLLGNGMRDDLGLFQATKIENNNGHLSRVYRADLQSVDFLFFDEISVFYFSNLGRNEALDLANKQNQFSVQSFLSWKKKVCTK
ncbi:hypothetical protein ACH42_12355 [Endozoicomonas sp. (ex Bugula neritina AB1)]|nr:hypothetical protein ACH42_12355 [Endozoicomonas sp. (ex Bugula neritina AB1)]